MANKSYEMDLCSGSIFKKVAIYAAPVILSGILQLLFNAVDMIVAGKYAGQSALAAIGATSSLINLLVNTFMGLSIGANVLVAHFYGANLKKELDETLHTAILTSLIGGIILAFIGFMLARPILAFMKTPDDIIDLSVIYMRIYFLGMPAMLIYNFGSSMLRAVGDTKRPLYYLSFAGLVNIGLNYMFVLCFHMSVDGVAIATVISQCISAILIIICLINNKGSLKLSIKKLRINGDKLFRMIKIGVPAGLQSAIFSLSNMLIQSSINFFGSTAVAGNTASSSIENFVYASMNSMYQTTLSFTSQNMGARKYDRIGKILIVNLIYVVSTGLILGYGVILFSKPLLGIYTDKPAIIEYGLIRLVIICGTYFTCGMMDVFVGALRGMGYNTLPMIVSLIGACGFRVFWIFTFFKAHHSLQNLYISYPISWVITGSVHLICFLVVYIKLRKKAGNTGYKEKTA